VLLVAVTVAGSGASPSSSGRGVGAEGMGDRVFVAAVCVKCSHEPHSLFF
jgi:hypothetical protein